MHDVHMIMNKKMKMKRLRGQKAQAFAGRRWRLLKTGLECAKTSTSLLHVLLLLGGSKYGSRVSLLQGEGALNLNSEWDGDGPRSISLDSF